MAVDAFLKLWSKGGSQLIGESSDDNMKDAIEVLDFSVRSQSLSGHKKKKKKKQQDKDSDEDRHEESKSKQMFTLKLTKDLDRSSPLLAQSYSSNRSTVVEPFEKGVLFVRKPGAFNFIFLKMTFLGLYVTDYKMSVKSETSIPTEDVSFGFRVLGINYVPQLTTGGRGKPKFAGWDLRANERNDHPA